MNDPNTDTYDVVLYVPTASVDVTVTPENAQLDLGAGQAMRLF